MATISKVAERAGVSRTTVSHVLNHADRVSAHLREKVLRAVDELGYVPNPQAKSLRTGRTDLVALLIPDIRNPFFPEIVGAAQSRLEAAGRDTLIFNADVPGGHAEQHTRAYLRQIRSRRADGLIVGAPALHGMHDALVDLDIPAVFIGDLPGRAVDSVNADDFGGARQMGAYLAERGHRRIAHVTGPSFFEEAVARARGFEAGLAGHGSGIEVIRHEGTYLIPSGTEAVERLVETHRGHLPTAMFFANFPMAVGGLAALADHGLRVPQDIAVGVFGDQPQMDYVRPRLTRVGVPPALLAERAAGMLIERLDGTHAGPPRTETIPCSLTAMDTA